ncbi:MAG: 3-isopropylmalate/(R)-2-methylmalate dehydratase small subunit [Chloroflexota bacterium]|jgi:3-isopropylmalate/(R)-2-methylmalate dehydratase small subunit|nr:3-isopropylmalate/(R)-2-methylmalate dehydratase small subunit [Chloroflexota bacterium]
MRAVSRVTGRAMPLDRRDVDTDQIIPSDWLKRVERTGYGAGLFEAWRADPAFVLNDPRFGGATVLVAGANFGCGSSREHAAWALEDWGFRAIVAPSFADIFRGNCRSVGLVTAELPEADVARIQAAIARDPSLEVGVDVDRRMVEIPALGYASPFGLDDASRARLLAGQDEIDLSLAHADAIASYEARRPGWLPRLRTAGAG